MTNVYKIELCVIDHDEIGADGIAEVLQDTKYPNRCIKPKVVTIEGKDIGEWDDNNLLNYRDTQKQELARLFSPWLPITTAPSKEYVLVYHPDYGVTEAIFDPEEVAIEDNIVDHVWVSSYCEDYWYTSVLDPTPLYWQHKPEPPTL